MRPRPVPCPSVRSVAIVAIALLAGFAAAVAAATLGGDDPGFGAQGRATVGFGGAAGVFAADVAVLPGDAVALGGGALVTTAPSAAVARLTSGGSLDTTFSGDGYDVHRFPGKATTISAAAAAPDGSVVLAGTAGPENGDPGKAVALVRYSAGGALLAAATAPYATGSEDSVANAVAALPDGRSIVAGYVTVGGDQQLLVGRLTSSGAIDTSFATVSESFPTGGAQARAVAISPLDGSIWVAGSATTPARDLELVLRHYGPNGAVLPGLEIARGSGSSLEGVAIAVGADGRPVVAATSTTGGASPRREAVLERFSSSPARDAAFGADADGFAHLGQPSTASGLALDGTGTAFLGGALSASQAFLAAFRPADGALDAGFASNGVRAIAPPSGFSAITPGGLRTDSRGRVVLAESLSGGPGGAATAAAHRLFGLTSPPTATTLTPSPLAGHEATLRAQVDPGNAPTAVRFVYGPSASSYTTTTPAVTVAASTTAQTVTAKVGGLAIGTPVHHRATATNLHGTATGDDVAFTPQVQFPLSATTSDPEPLAPHSATLRGTVTVAAGDAVTAHLDYRIKAAAAVAPWNEGPPVALSGAGALELTRAIDGLDDASPYETRVVASDADQTVTGDARSFTTPPETSEIGAAIAVPFDRSLVSGATFTLNGSGSVTPAKYGPLKYEWDFGENRPWDEADVANPSAKGFVAQATGATVTHRFVAAPDPDYKAPPGSLASLGNATTPFGKFVVPPSNVPHEKRGTWLVRLRVTDRFDRSRIVGVPVVVQPDRAPIAGFATTQPIKIGGVNADTLEYARPTVFRSLSSDPDATPKFPARDRVLSERWSIEGQPFIRNIPDDGSAPDPLVGFNYFADLKVRSGAPDVDTIPIPPVPAPTVGNAAGVRFADILAEGAQAKFQQLADSHAYDGPSHSGTKTVALTVTDRSGLATSVVRKLPMRQRVVPIARADFGSLLPPPNAEGNAIAGGATTKPIVADAAEAKDPAAYDQGGTKVSLDLSSSRPDPDGRIVAYAVQMGLPSNGSCSAANRKAGKCKKTDDDRLAAVIRSAVVPAAQGGKFTLTFPYASPDGKPWSIRVTAIDETGAMGATRYDGFVALAPGKPCQEIADGVSIVEGRSAFTGSCVNVSKNHELYWTQKPISLNGVRIAPPADGGWTLIADHRVIGVANDKKPPLSAITNKDAERNYLPPKTSLPLTLQIEGTDVATIPSDRVAGLVEKGTTSLTALDAARYRGFPIADGGLVVLEMNPKYGGSYASRLRFVTQMPAAFAGEAGDRSTATTTLRAKIEVKGVVITPFDHLVDATAARRAIVKARAADQSGQAPPTMAVQDGQLKLGSLVLPVPNGFAFDAATQSFKATAKFPFFGQTATLTLYIKDGKFALADGIIPTKIVVAPNFSIDQIHIQMSGDPDVALHADVKINDITTGGYLVSATGGFTQTFKPQIKTHLGVDALLAALIPASANIDISGAGVSFDASIGKDFGPASFRAQVDGIFGANGFNVHGKGEACLFACLGVEGVLSNNGVAACGSIDLLFTSLRAGFGYGFKSSPSPGAHVFVGSCDFAPFSNPNALGRAALDEPAASAVAQRTPPLAVPAAVKAPKGSRTLKSDPTPLPKVAGLLPTPAVQGVPILNGASSFTVPRPGFDALAVVVHGLNTGPLSLTPRVTLTSPTGQTWTTTPVLGGLSLQGNALVDQDVAASDTRFIVKAPGPNGVPSVTGVPTGSWKITPLDASTPAVSTDWSLSLPTVDRKLFTTARVEQAPAAIRTAILRDPSKNPITGSLTAASGIKQSKLTVSPAVKKTRALTAGGGVSETALRPAGTVSAWEAGQAVRLRWAMRLPPGERVAFTVHGTGGTQELASYTEPVDGDGLASDDGTTIFVPPVAPAGATEAKTESDGIDATIYGEDGLSRGTIEDLVTFTAKRPLAPAQPPDDAAMKRRKDEVVVLFRNPGPPRESTVAWFEAVADYGKRGKSVETITQASTKTVTSSKLRAVTPGGSEPTKSFTLSGVSKSTAVKLTLRGVGAFSNQKTTMTLEGGQKSTHTGSSKALAAGM